MMLKVKTFGYDVEKKTVTVMLQAECHEREMEGIVGNLIQLLKTDSAPAEASKAKPKKQPKATPTKEPEPETEPVKAVAEPTETRTRPGEKKPPKQPTLYDGDVVVHSRKTKNNDTILQLFGGKLVLIKGGKEAGRKDAPAEDVAKHNAIHAQRWEPGMDYYNRAVEAVEIDASSYNVRLTLCDGVRVTLGPDDKVVNREPPEGTADDGQTDDPVLDQAKAASSLKDVVKIVADDVGVDFDKVLEWCTTHKDQVPRLKRAKPEKFETSIKRALTVACG